MKGGRRTAKGRIINLDDLIASSPHTTSVGNMKVDAKGNKLGPGGEIEQTREKRTRSYYKDHPQSSNRKVSLKGEMTEAFAPGYNDLRGAEPKTAKTAYENVRTSQTEVSETKAPEFSQPEVSEPPEFDDYEMPADLTDADQEVEYDTEPTGYREIELDNGDIVIQPYWDDEDDV